MGIMEPKVAARLKLAALAVVTGVFLATACTPDPSPPLEPPPGSTCDREVFERIVSRVRAGDGFYDATQEELRAHGYPTRSVFNWRTPCYAWFLGAFPSGLWCRLVLVAITVAALGMAGSDLLRDNGVFAASVGGVLLVGSTAWCFTDFSYLFTELWAGVAILLSVCALRRGWTALGVSAGLLAVFDRELALPYALVSLGLAAWNGRRREALAWAVGLGLFLAFMAAHAHVVAGRVGDLDQALEGGWVRFGGPRFVLATARMNVFLMAAPPWLSALILPPAVFGLSHWPGGTGDRVGLTVLLYLAAFSVVGAPFNYYWGFIDAPLLALGLARAPAALGETLKSAGFVAHRHPLRSRRFRGT